MIGHGKTSGHMGDSQQEVLAQVRPPEENPTTTLDAPNKEKGRNQTDTDQNNRQDPNKGSEPRGPAHARPPERNTMEKRPKTFISIGGAGKALDASVAWAGPFTEKQTTRHTH